MVRTARINCLGEVPDGWRRLFVPDINGAMYLVENGQPRLYLDVGRAFAPGFFSGRGLGHGFAFVGVHPEFGRNGKFYTVHTETGTAVPAKNPAPSPRPNALDRGTATAPAATGPSARAL